MYANVTKNVQNLTELLTVIIYKHARQLRTGQPGPRRCGGLTTIQIQFSTREGLVRAHNEQASSLTVLRWTAGWTGPPLPSESLCCPGGGQRTSHLIGIEQPSPQPASAQEVQLWRRSPSLPWAQEKAAPRHLADYLDFGYSHPQGGD